jgi:hypothetical protein
MYRKSMFENLNEVKELVQIHEDDINRKVELNDLPEHIKKGVILTVNNDIMWDGVENLSHTINNKLQMWYAKIMTDLDGDGDEEEKYGE